MGNVSAYRIGYDYCDQNGRALRDSTDHFGDAPPREGDHWHDAYGERWRIAVIEKTDDPDLVRVVSEPAPDRP